MGRGKSRDRKHGPGELVMGMRTKAVAEKKGRLQRASEGRGD